jgi:glycerophosphoryl diester phosphodiesterase
MHWSRVDETTDGHGHIGEFSLAELLRLDAGYHCGEEFRGKGIRVATLREFMDEFVAVPDLLFCLDFKDEEAVVATLRFIEPYDIAHRIVLSACFREANEALFRWRPSTHVPMGTTIGETFKLFFYYYTGLIEHYEVTHDIYFFVLCRPTLPFWSRNLVTMVHSLGCRMAVSAFGPEMTRPARLRQCIEYGVDFIMTDRPDVLARLLNVPPK